MAAVCRGCTVAALEGSVPEQAIEGACTPASGRGGSPASGGSGPATRVSEGDWPPATRSQRPALPASHVEVPLGSHPSVALGARVAGLPGQPHPRPHVAWSLLPWPLPCRGSPLEASRGCQADMPAPGPDSSNGSVTGTLNGAFGGKARGSLGTDPSAWYPNSVHPTYGSSSLRFPRMTCVPPHR